MSKPKPGEKFLWGLFEEDNDFPLSVHFTEGEALAAQEKAPDSTIRKYRLVPSPCGW